MEEELKQFVGRMDRFVELAERRFDFLSEHAAAVDGRLASLEGRLAGVEANMATKKDLAELRQAVHHYSKYVEGMLSS